MIYPLTSSATVPLRPRKRKKVERIPIINLFTCNFFEENLTETLKATKGSTVFNFEDMCTERSTYEAVALGRSGVQLGRLQVGGVRTCITTIIIKLTQENKILSMTSSFTAL